MPSIRASLVSVAVVLVVIPGGYSGPACAQRAWSSVDECVASCGQRWGWTGYAMGTDPWGSVVTPAEGDVSAWVAAACGVAVPASASAVPSSTRSLANSAPTLVPVASSAPAPVVAAPVSSVTAPAPSNSSTSSSSSARITSSSIEETSSALPTSTKPASSPVVNVAPEVSPSKPTSTTPPPPPKTATAQAQPEKTQAPQTVQNSSSGGSSGNSDSNSGSSNSSGSGNTSGAASGGNSASTSSGGSVSSADIQAYLSAHNSVRSQHGASPLSWDNNLEAKAQQWANNCVFQHSGGSLGPFGENLAAGSGDSYTIASAVKSWTDEVSQYNPSNPVASHFTQVVWKASTQVGCAEADCDGIFAASFGKAHFHVCEYSVQGNVIGEFAQNVQL